MLGPYTPEILRRLVLVFVSVAALLLVVPRQRRPAAIVAFMMLVVGTGLILSLAKTYDDLGTVYFQAARLLLPLPIGLWLVTTCLDPLPGVMRWRRWSMLGLVVVVGVTATWRVAT